MNDMTHQEAEDLVTEYPALAGAIEALHANHPGGFIAITRYTATSKRIVPEVANWTLNGNVIYSNILRRSIELARQIDVAELAATTARKVRRTEPAKAVLIEEQVGGVYAVAQAALDEELASLERSLFKIESGEPVDETHYEQLGAGAKRHQETGELHLSGLQVEKRVVVPGEYKPVNSNPKTLVKDEIRRRLPIGKWRQFKLTPDKFHKVAVAGMVIEGEAA